MNINYKHHRCSINCEIDCAMINLLIKSNNLSIELSKSNKKSNEYVDLTRLLINSDTTYVNQFESIHLIRTV
jgi:hypothetical protein